MGYSLLALVISVMTGQPLTHFHGSTVFPTKAACEMYRDGNIEQLIFSVQDLLDDTELQDGTYNIVITCEEDGFEPAVGVVTDGRPIQFTKNARDPWALLGRVFGKMIVKGGFGHLDNSRRD